MPSINSTTLQSQNLFLFNQTTLFLSKGHEKSLRDLTGTIFVRTLSSGLHLKKKRSEWISPTDLHEREVHHKKTLLIRFQHAVSTVDPQHTNGTRTAPNPSPPHFCVRPDSEEWKSCCLSEVGFQSPRRFCLAARERNSPSQAVMSVFLMTCFSQRIMHTNAEAEGLEKQLPKC